MLLSKTIKAAALLICSAAAFPATAQTQTAAPVPARVVSLNVCTDQLALLLAQPGQLVSVSRLAHDARTAVLAEQARAIPSNDGSAEAVVLLQPDLVIAGTWTTQSTVQMLERLGYRVELFAPANALSDVRETIRRMGVLLGQTQKAEQMIADFDSKLEALRAQSGQSPRVALYYALGNTAGRETMPGDLLDAAGMSNIAEERGLPFGGRLPLESLLLEDPDLVLIGQPYGGHARATELLTHPALQRSGALHEIETGPSWTCELPHLLDAVQELIALRRQWEASQ
ncbi:ABC transporter substrate-binding protein [Thalassococcus lentus]|uniref:ABC transporter substrate-binding protein n=1 Tax=Thalassococcus lentus TaxID=1210524 RepID=A0ABT4XTV6_9RHOB|nr:ABC transporter substrate-binding protein [Thalassococcus lentus]MDA7425337.1 ABC transporter substrate-binding protein [Thalassococcus lentus]